MPGMTLSVRLYIQPNNSPITKAWGIWAGFRWISANSKAEMAIAVHGLEYFSSSDRRIAPRNTTSSASGAIMPNARYPPGVLTSPSKLSFRKLGSSGIFSCNQSEGTMMPIAARKVQNNTAKGRDLRKSPLTGIHRRHKNSATVITPKRMVVVTSSAPSSFGTPPATRYHTPITQ